LACKADICRLKAVRMQLQAFNGRRAYVRNVNLRTLKDIPA